MLPLIVIFALGLMAIFTFAAMILIPIGAVVVAGGVLGILQLMMWGVGFEDRRH